MNDNPKMLTPKLRFPQFHMAEEWVEPTLQKISVPVVERVGDLQLTPVSISAGIGFVAQAEKFGRDISGSQYRLYTLVRDGDFVYNKGNSLKFPQGCIYELQGWGEVAAPNVFICFRLKDGYVNGFFRYCFENNVHGLQLRKHITSGARSNGLLNINKDDFFGITIPTPRREEQQKIADCLSSLDELITAEGRKLEALRVHKKGLMQQLFPCVGETRPQLRFPEFCDGREWEARKIGDLLEKVSLPIEVQADKTYREIGVRSHGKGIFHKDQVKGAAIGTMRVFQVIEDAFVLNIVFAWEQAVAFTTKTEAGMIASHRFPMFLPKSNACDVRFLKLAFLTPTGKHLLHLASPGGAGRNRTLGQDEFDKIEIVVPDKDEQTKVADVILAADALIAAQSRKLDGLRVHKKGLMQQLFPSSEEM